MKTTCFLILLVSSIIGSPIDRKMVYTSLSDNSSQSINEILVEIEKTESSSLNRAYKGALLARKAEFEKNIKQKIRSFKAGVQLLEKEINLNPKHTEYRFLRLCIQEHCPPILKYNKNIKEDVQLITNSYSGQSKNLKSIIFEYSKKSKAIDQTLLK